MITAPNKDIYGASVSGTVFSAIANKVYASTLRYHKAVNEGQKVKGPLPQSYSGYSHDLKTVFRGLRIPYSTKVQSDWVNTKADEKEILFQARPNMRNAMPNVVGLTAKDAVYLIEKSGMIATLKGTGKVVQQYPYAGSSIIKGGIAQIVLE